MKRNGPAGELRKNWLLFVMLLPAVLYFLIFKYLPMPGVVLAFKDFDYRGGIFGSRWIGFKNFGYIFGSGDIAEITRNTALYNLSWLAILTTSQVAIAIFLTEMSGKYYRRFCQSVMLLPYFISFVILAAFVYNTFNYEYGSLNTLLQSLGLPPVNVYDKPFAWIFILTGAHIWKWIGYGTVLFLAALVGIDRQYYEAATIDGAGIARQIRHITLPLLRPTVVIYLLLQLGYVLFGQFQLFYQITGDNANLLGVTDVIDTYVFRALLRNFDVGIAAAVGLYQSFFGFVLIVTANAVVRRFENENALF